MKWVRTIAAAILGVIAVVGLLASVVGFWARDTVFDESEVAGAVEAAVEEPGVTDALSARLADSIMTTIDLETRLNAILPPALQRHHAGDRRRHDAAARGSADQPSRRP